MLFASLSGLSLNFVPFCVGAADGSQQLAFGELIKSAEWVLFPIGLLSFLIFSLVIFNFIFLRRKTVASAGFLSLADRLLQDRNIEAMIDLCTKSDEYCARVLAKVLLFAKQNPRTNVEGLQKIAESEGAALAAKLNLPSQLLMDLGVISPMVGLLGTVYGILTSFGHLAANEATPMKTMLLAGGVSQALISTFMGLVVGVTAMFFYAFFRARVQVLIGYFESSLTPLLVKTCDRLAGE